MCVCVGGGGGGGGGSPMVKFAVATKPISFLFKKSKSDTFSLWGDSTLTSISLSVRPVSLLSRQFLRSPTMIMITSRTANCGRYYSMVSEIQANGNSRTVDDRVLLLLNVA